MCTPGAIDAVTAFFRGLLGEGHGLIHHTSECQTTLGCPPRPAPVCAVACPGPCGPTSTPASRSHFDAIYWLRVPPALDSIAVDVYAWPDTGVAEVTRTRAFYKDFVFPKLGSDQRVWLVPGLFAPIEPAASVNASRAHSVNDSHFVSKMEAYAEWTAAEPRIVGWMPFHFYNRLWSPTPDSGSWGAEVMPQTLRFLQRHSPPPLHHKRSSNEPKAASEHARGNLNDSQERLGITGTVKTDDESGKSRHHTVNRTGGGCSHPPGCWCAGSPLVATCPPKRHATWWLTTEPAGGPIGGPSNLEFIQKHRAAVTRVALFCWQISDNGTFTNDEVGCGSELLGPIHALGVELFPAGSPTRAALLNNTWHIGLAQLAHYAVAHNWTGIHVDFEEGTSRMEPGLVSEQLYAYFLSTLSQVTQQYNLLIEVDIGENFPVQDHKLDVDNFYLDSLGSNGRLAIMNPTYTNEPPYLRLANQSVCGTRIFCNRISRYQTG
eukprot:COSAG05_NODE_2661_length_2791_cov_183.266716_1_plen_491_part_00